MNEEAILKALSEVLTPYFMEGTFPHSEPGPSGDFVAIELTNGDPEGFRIAGLEPPEADEVDDGDI